MYKRIRSVFAWFFLFTLPLTLSARANDTELRQALAPQVAHLKLRFDDWRILAEHQVVTRELPVSHAKEMAGFGAMLADIAPDEIVAAFRSLNVFKQSSNILACGRFSHQPSFNDLAGLKLKDKDVLELMRAKEGNSDIKLSALDITRLQTIAGPAAGFSNQLISNLTAEYKQLLLEKVKAYIAQGSQGLSDLVDQEEPVSAGESLNRMLRYQSSVSDGSSGSAQLYTLLAEYPRRDVSESFVYWVVQKFGQLKPVISLVHVLVYKEGARVFIASKQIYSNHYTEAGFTVAELVPFNDAQGRPHTLVAYTIRLQVDLLGGTTGFLKRRMAQPRMLETLKESLLGLRRNVEAARTEVAN